MELALTDQLVSSFQVAKVFKESSTQIQSLDIDDSGAFVVTSSLDESIHVYDAKNGRKTKTIPSLKYGCSLARFTHRSSNLVYASTKFDDQIRYMSTFDNKFITYFEGHKARVIGLEMSPQNDNFISCSLDGSVRLWDLSMSKPLGTLRANGIPSCVAFDQAGIIFATSFSTGTICLYDVKQYSKGPFYAFTISDPYRADWTKLTISNDGKMILISTNSNYLLLVDAFNGQIIHRLQGHANQASMPMEASFTADCKYVICGSQDGAINFWNVTTGEHVAALKGHYDPVKCVLFNPLYMMFVSADSNLAFWIPPL